MMNQEETSIDEALQRSVGEFGYGQIRIYLLTNIAWVITALQLYLMVFTETDSVLERHWRCKSENDTFCSRLAYNTIEDSKLRQEFCQMRRDQWEWMDRGYSIVSEFNLACDGWKVHLLKAIFFVGQLLGSGLLGYAADKIGRKPALFLSAGLSGFSTLCGAFAPSYWMYFALRFLTGFGSGGQVVASFVLWSEFVGPSKRGKLGIAVQFFFTVGQCFLAVLAYLLPVWRPLVLAVGALSLTFFFTSVWIPESPRWLLIRGKKGEAAAILAAVASANRTKLPEMPLAEMATAGNTDRMILEVLKHKRLREWLLISMATWFSVFTIFYGIALMHESIAGDLYLKFFLMAIIEVPAYLVHVLLVDRVGRQPLYVWGLLIGGISCILMLALPGALMLPLAMAGKFAAAGALALAFLYTTETFPTSVRAVCLGAASLAARLGGVFAPAAIDLGGVLGHAIPPATFGVIGIMASVLALGLPETVGAPLPDTVEDIPAAPAPRRRWWSCFARKKHIQNYARLDDAAGT